MQFVGTWTPFNREQLPQDQVKRTITSVGPLTRTTRKNSEPTWQITLTEDGGEDGHVYADVPSAYIMQMRVGSIWTSGRMDHPIGERGSTSRILVDCAQQSLHLRCMPTGHSSNKIIFSPHPTKNGAGVPYVMMPIRPYLGCDRALIRCSELFRAFFGANIPLARFAFDFSPNGWNEHLYNHRKTGMKVDGTFNFFRSSKLIDQQAVFVAQMIYMEATLSALCQLSTSARKATLAGQDVWPIMLAPMSRVSRWKVYGAPKSGIFKENDEQITETRFFAIAQLLGTDFTFTGPPINIESTAVERRRRAGHKPSGHSTSSSRTSSLPPTLVSDTAPGNSARKQEINHDQGDMFPGMRFGEVTHTACHVDGASSKAPVLVKNKQEVDRFSGLLGGAGDDRVGHYDIVQPGQGKQQAKDVQPIIPTTSLFALHRPPQIIVSQTRKEEVPPKFSSVIAAISSLAFAPTFQNAVFKAASRGPVCFPYDTMDLLQIPPEWGESGKTAESPSGYRRVMWIDIVVPDGRIALLDVEGRYRAESVGAQIYLFPSKLAKAADINLIGQLLYCKVCGGGWPNADAYFEPFYSMALNHVSLKRRDHDEATQNRIFSKLSCAMSLLKAA